MSKTKKANILWAMCAAALITASMAWGKNGVVYYEFHEIIEEGDFYVPCLGEYVIGGSHITGTYHEFTTPSGTWHLLDNWKIVGQYTGFTTGRTWTSKGVSPFQGNIGPGESVQWVLKEIMKPLTGDGPIFIFANEFKITVTANGDLVVDRPNNPNIEELTRCVGKK